MGNSIGLMKKKPVCSVDWAALALGCDGLQLAGTVHALGVLVLIVSALNLCSAFGELSPDSRLHT